MRCVSSSRVCCWFSLAGTPFVVAMPNGAKWVQLAKQVAAGIASDNEVCSFKLNFSVLEKLPLDFVAAAYEQCSLLAQPWIATSHAANSE